MKISLLSINLSIFLILAGCEAESQEQVGLGSTTLQIDTVITGLNVPWEIQWGPDGWIWMTERYGVISRVNPENGNRDELLDLSDDVYQAGEAGMLGLVLHPGFNDTAHVFVVYTYNDGDIKEKLVRYNYNGTDLVDAVILIDDIPGGNTHDGSRLLILPDRTLLMTTGDARISGTPQNISSPAGKTLRINLDGSIPGDNPIEESPVWSWGHRNHQGLLLAPNGNIYSSEHGPDTDDEINILEKGKNYGWPDVEGFCDTPGENDFCNENNVVEPLINWTPTIAPSDIIWYNHPSIPEFQNTILMAVLKEKKIVRITLNETGEEVIETEDFFNNRWGRLRDILQGPNGEIYIATNGASWSNTDPFTHSIIRLKKSESTTSGNAYNPKRSLSVFPNPVTDKLHISVGNSLSVLSSVLLLDYSGKIVKKMHNIAIETLDEGLNVEALPAGTYTLIVKINYERISKQFIKY
jgi:aldose sugar dehydrogenase